MSTCSVMVSSVFHTPMGLPAMQPMLETISDQPNDSHNDNHSSTNRILLFICLQCHCVKLFCTELRH